MPHQLREAETSVCYWQKIKLSDCKKSISRNKNIARMHCMKLYNEQGALAQVKQNLRKVKSLKNL